MTALKCGDRVRWRGSDLKGTVVSVDKLDVEVECDDRTTTIFHPELLIKLKPRKPKAESKPPREFRIFAHKYPNSNPNVSGWSHPPKVGIPIINGDLEEIHVTELPPGSVVVTREELAKAWENTFFGDGDNVAHAVKVWRDGSCSFLHDLYEALGLSPEGKG